MDLTRGSAKELRETLELFCEKLKAFEDLSDKIRNIEADIDILIAGEIHPLIDKQYMARKPIAVKGDHLKEDPSESFIAGLNAAFNNPTDASRNVSSGIATS